MTSTGSTQQTVTRAPAQTLERLRGASMGALVMLIIQFALGSAVNLYSTPHKGGVGEAFSNGPLLVLHAVLGVLLVLAAIGLLVQSIMARYRFMIVLSVIGLIAILGAASNGVSFLSNHQAGASLGMAIATAVAMACYAVALRVLGSERAGA
jgi:hypothetical protein